MRYLVSAEFIDLTSLVPPQQFAQFVETVIVPSLEAIAKLEAQKKILAAGVFTAARAGVLILDAASHEEVNQLLQSLPFWGVHKWDVRPLTSFSYRAEQERQLASRLKAAQ